MSIDPISAVLDIGGKLIDRLWPDPAQADAAKLELYKLHASGELAQMQADTSLALGQIEVNKAEAASGSLFISGWRPAIGWICGLACAWNWIGISVIDMAAKLYGASVVLAPADVGEMWPVLAGLLGLGTLRSFERVKGVHRSS